MTLKNGLRILLLNRDTVPLVEMRLLVRAGNNTERGLVGLPGMVADMLDEGAGVRTSAQIAEDIELLGPKLETRVDADYGIISLSTPIANLEASLKIFGDVALKPRFEDGDIERIRTIRLGSLEKILKDPWGLLKQVFPALLYEDGIPFHGYGTKSVLQSLRLKNLRVFYEDRYRPNNSTLVVVGDISMGELQPMLEETFGSWKRGVISPITTQITQVVTGKKIYLVNRPNAEQSLVVGLQVIPGRKNIEYETFMLAKAILGGWAGQGRIYKNLRHKKGWSYGAGTHMWEIGGNNPFVFHYAPVQKDRTADSLSELMKEVGEFVSIKPPTSEELAMAQKKATLTLSGDWSSNVKLLDVLTGMVRYGYPTDHWNGYPERIEGLDISKVTQVSQTWIKPDQTIWIVVGDREKIEAGLRVIPEMEVEVIQP